MKLTDLQVDVLRYLISAQSAPAWRVAREVLNAPRDEGGHVRSQGAVNSLRSLRARGFVKLDGERWSVTGSGMDALAEYAFGEPDPYVEAKLYRRIHGHWPGEPQNT